jgi:hypothetical protein
MARQDINIGVEGNDGTGDSIRESFRKVNENFQEIYAIFGQSGTISFTALSDTPDSLLPNTIPLVKTDGSGLDLVELASNSALDSQATDTITFSYSVPGKLVISTGFTQLSDDTSPGLGAPLNAAANAIANIAVSEEAAQQFNDIHNTNINIDDLVINKGYADRRYISSGLPIRVSPEPLTQDPYKLNISRYLNGDIEVVNHGYDTSINGLKFVFDSIYNDPINLNSEEAATEIIEGNTYKIKAAGNVPWLSIGADFGTVGEVFTATGTTSATGVVQPVYFLRYVSENLLSVFLTREDAAIVSDTEADAAKTYVSGIKADDDIHQMVDTGVDPNLEGNFLSDVAMPRDAIVRRQGDTMEGILTLSDHPGELSGFGKPNGADDLQAATKFYVDNAGYASTQNLFVSLDGDDRMVGVPPGKEGASLNYAFRTINAAARRAEEIIKTSAPEPGPYFQTVTKEENDSPAEVTTRGFAGTDNWGGIQTGDLIKINREYLIKEVSGWIKYTFPDFVYDIDLCERDTGLILDALEYDIRRGLTANFLSIQAAERYYSSVSGRVAITQQKDQTLGAIAQLSLFVDAVLRNKLYNEKEIDFVTLSGDSDERARVQTNTDHGLVDGDQIIFKNMGGMVEIEGQSAYVKNIASDDIALDGKIIELYKDANLLELWDISSYTPYTAGGVLGQVFQDRVDDFDSIKIDQTFDQPNADDTARLAITGDGGKIDQIIDIMRDGINAAPDIVYGMNYKLVLDNGSRAFVDQADPDNTDTLPGKIMIGNISGAEGRIVKVTNNDGTEDNNDTFELIQLNGKDFAVNETVRYGNFVKQKQVTIFVESGIYEEDLPIKISNNVSLKGDEFRRVIIRPKRRVSQSPWADTYFFRDNEFDEIPLATTGSPFYNQTGELQGYFGRHYLSNNELAKNTGPTLVNPGDYEIAAEVMSLNKKFIQEEVIHYVDNNKNELLYNRNTCRRDLRLVLDAVAYDVATGSNYKTVTAGLAYQRANNAYNLAYERQNTIIALTEAKSQVGALAAVVADVTAGTRSNAAFDEIIDIINNNTPDALTYPVPSVLPSTDADDAHTRLANNKTFIQKEVVAWIEENFPLLDYNVAKCERDVGYIVDALAYDILYGGNSATRAAAESYFVGAISQLGVGERDATVAAYDRLGDVVDEIVRGVAVTPSTGNLEVQDTSGNNASATEGTALNNLVNIIETVISEGDLVNLPVETQPSIVYVDDGIENAANSIVTNRNTIVDDVIEYLDNNIIFIYNTEKCYRDVGLIVDAIIKDLLRGGQEFALEAQGEYYSNYILQYNIDENDDTAGFGGQANITKAAMQHIATLTSDLLAGIAPAKNVNEDPDVSLGAAETGTVTLVDGLVDLVTFAFEPGYNPPKRNDDDQVDAFMMSDASILRNVTVQGQGGFMVVLDPEGQILTKSPYIQTGSSFSKSDNEKRFRGGMYVDAFTGNIPVYVPQNINTGSYNGSGKISNFELWVRSEEGQGLFIRPPELPCPFYVEGRRFQVNAISDYDSGNGWCKIYLDSDSNDGVGYDESQFPDGLYYRDIFLQTAGNRSMLGNDFTQINDLGYGLVTNNGAFSEMVSMFTYYCQAAYYAKNGSEIRSLNGSNGYGFFGLVAEGADPNEIPDQVTLRDPMVVPAKAYTTPDTTNAFEESSLFVTDMRYKPTVNSQITIDHGGSVGVLNYVISNVTNISDSDNDGIEGDSPDDILAVGNTYSNTVYRFDLRADDVSATDFFGSLRDTVPDGAIIEYRHNFTLAFDGVRDPSKLVTRPSTAINFDESDDITYRSLSFQNVDTFEQPLAADEIFTGIEVGFGFVVPEIDTGNLSGGYGSAQGDTKIAIKQLPNPKDRIRITRDIAGRQPGDPGYSGGMVFTWYGKMHRVIDYNDAGAFTYITIEDQGTNISAYSGAGVAVGISPSDRVLHCGLDTGATAEITIAISLCRATGHDFTQIGTGGFNSSNYPNVILGDPENDLADSYSDAPTATTAQVWERRKGRVFWMSTDQYGFFRVGKFFSVDQSTGDIEFAGEIGITNANSLGFKRGVTINEFSADDSMADNSGQAVPTEKAMVGYLNRVLGWNVGAGSQIQPAPFGNRIGTGFLPLNGGSAMEADLDMGSNNITNVALPGTDGTAAANKNYVDDKVNDYDQLEDLRNIEFNNIASNDILVATGAKRLVLTPTTGGNWSVGDQIGLNNSSTKLGTIVDIEPITDSLLGNQIIVTYTVDAGEFVVGETLYDKPNQTVFATISDGPIDEVANATTKKVGSAADVTYTDIDVTVERDASGATINLQYVADSIIDNDVNSGANIRQSKLLMQAADTFDEDNATTGWAGSQAKVQADLGLAKFSDENFETTQGFVRIKNNGIVFAEIPDLAQNQLYGRTAAGTGDASAISFSDVAKFGDALEDKDFNNREWADASVTRLVFTSRVSVNDGDTITQGAAISGTAQGTVDNEFIVYVKNVTGGNFNTSGTVTDTTLSTTLGVPDTANAITDLGSALIRLGDGDYATTDISIGTAGDTIARRDDNGKLDAAGLLIGSYDTIALNSTTISFKTPGGATIFEATGNASADLQTKIPGHLVLGGITNNAGNTAFNESAAKSGSTSYDVGSYIASSWMYTNFIEAASESGGNANVTTGIGLGAGNGFTDAAADTILLIANGAPRITVKDGSIKMTENVEIDTANLTVEGNTYINAANSVFRIRNGSDATNRFIVDTDNGNTTINGTITVAGAATFNGNVTIGNAASDTVTITADVASNIIPNNTDRNIGASGSRWNTMYAQTFNGTATTAKYADLAENYVGDAEYEPGTVLVFGGDAEVTTTNVKGDHRVAGVVSTDPAYLMNSELDAVNTVAIALTGRVPCKVIGKVQKGDMLVTSAIPGYAMVDNSPGVGRVIGKALESKDDSDKGTIEMVVGRT